MIPVEFKECNKVFRAPPGMDNCDDLHCLMTDDQIVSCWKLTLWERIKLLFTGTLWHITVTTGAPLPVVVTANRPFYTGNKAEKALEEQRSILSDEVRKLLGLSYCGFEVVAVDLSPLSNAGVHLLLTGDNVESLHRDIPDDIRRHFNLALLPPPVGKEDRRLEIFIETNTALSRQKVRDLIYNLHQCSLAAAATKED